jgi:hypothetical protein
MMLLTSQTTGETESFSVVVDGPSSKPTALFINDEGYLS